MFLYWDTIFYEQIFPYLTNKPAPTILPHSTFPSNHEYFHDFIEGQHYIYPPNTPINRLPPNHPARLTIRKSTRISKPLTYIQDFQVACLKVLFLLPISLLRVPFSIPSLISFLTLIYLIIIEHSLIGKELKGSTNPKN